MRFLSPQWVAVTATLVLVGGSAAGWMAWQGGDSEDDPRAEPPGLEEAAAVADALGNLAADPAGLVATDVRSALANRAREAVPAGATVTPNAASWQPDGLGGGTMTVSVAGGGQPTTTYSAIMVKEAAGWKVVGTVPMLAPGAGSAPAAGGQAPAANAPGPVAPATQPVVPQPGAGQQGTQPGAGQSGAQQNRGNDERPRRNQNQNQRGER